MYSFHLATWLAVSLAAAAELREIKVPPDPHADSVIAIVGARLIDGRGGQPVENAVVVVRGSKIAAAGPQNQVTIPDNAKRLDAAGLSVLPGLIDSHFHSKNDVIRPVEYELKRGITTFRDPGHPFRFYDAVKVAEATMPRIFLCGGHLDAFPPAHPDQAFVITDVDHARRTVNDHIDAGATSIKIYMRLPIEHIATTCDAATKRGVLVTAHLELVDADDAINAGVRGIEHITSFGTALAESEPVARFKRAVTADGSTRHELRHWLWSTIDLDRSPRVKPLLDLIVRKNVFVSPTLAVFEKQAGAKGATDADAAGFANMLKFTGLCHQAGAIVVGSHTSAPHAPTGRAFQRELELLVSAGLTPLQAITAATRNNAQFFGIDNRLGTIEPGKLADLVLVAGDPASDIRAMNNVRHVMLNGIWQLGPVGQAALPAPPPPEKVFLNGTVITMAAEGDTAQAIAVRAGKITSVGTNQQIRALAGSETSVIDLQGKTVLPGFYAAHDHFPSAGRVALFEVDLNSPPMGTMKTIDDIVTALWAKAATTPAGKWVVGRGYDDTLIREQRHPTRHDLDRVSTQHPIWIVHTSGHLGVANSRALELAKITKDTPQTDGGVIRKDPSSGEPNGVIEERTSLVGRLVPAISHDQRLEAIRLCNHEYLAKGVTTTVIAGGAGNVVPDLLEARQRGWLKLRALAMVAGGSGQPASLTELAGRSQVPEYVRTSGVKMFQDGSLQGFTGYLTAQYHTQPDGKSSYAGYPARPRERLLDMVRAYHRAGYQIAIHANGDAAIDDVLHAFRTVQQEMPRTDTRHRIEHCQTPREDQLDQMKELGITPSFFVGHVYYWGDRHQNIFLGPDRAARISPLASAVKRGIRFTIHNDTPVTPVDPLLLVWCSVNRMTKDRQVLGPEQRIPVFAALRAVTLDAAWQNFEESTKGSLEPGKVADLVVLAENPLTIEPSRLKDIEILETIVAGESCYQRPKP